MYSRLFLLTLVLTSLAWGLGPARDAPKDEEILAALRKGWGAREPQIQIDGDERWVPLRNAKSAACITGLSLC